ncbi:glyoxalase family protein [bacterium DOLJORAL78_65_58]|nr:MAG: glyoxalase family protein [bacterium DOLZORAL124_64_63]PIE76431.1 MAG: glyoxalase family protein [bacterium DOLJORAL78_65_58]
MSTPNGIDYIEFTTRNLEATKTFFTTAFGWTFTDYGAEYASFREGDIRGGFVQMDIPACGRPLVVIYTKDLKAAMKKVKAAKGQITVDLFEFPGGKRFHFVEPGGNELAVWSE